MKKFLFVFLLGLFGQAQAAGFDALAWTTSTTDVTGTAGVNFLADNTTVEITGCHADPTPLPFPPYSTPNPCGPAETKLEAQATTNGSVSFDWTVNADPATASVLVWLLDSAGTELTLAAECMGGGSCTFDVMSGSLFGFALNEIFGASPGFPAVATISAFNWQPSGIGGVGEVPLPPAFLLFGAALAGLGFVKKRRLVAA